MHDIAKTLAALALVLGAGPLQAQSLESLKAASWTGGSWRAQAVIGLPTPAGRPLPLPAPRPRQSAGYVKGGYTFESTARAAMTQAENNMRAAGVPVMGASLYKETNFPFDYGFRVDYLLEQGGWRMNALRTYRGVGQTFESDAVRDMQAAIQNLRAAGETVILGQIIKDAAFPFNYRYEIDYLGRQVPPRREEVLTGGPYWNPQQAERAMREKVRELEYRGFRVRESRLERRGREFFFRIVFDARR